MLQKIRKQLLPIIVFAKIDIKRLFRDKVAIFFVFVFPLIFLGVFGGLFGQDSDVSFNVAVINQSESQFSKDFVKEIKKGDVFEINKESKTLSQAKEKMNRNEIDATIILPEEFGEVKPGDKFPSGQAKILYEKNNEQAGQTMTAIMDGVFKKINKEITKAPTPFTVVAESTATEGLRSFDYIFSGLLGFSILSLGIFGPTTVFPRLKQRGVLRRYHTTSLKVWQYFVGNVISNAFYGVLSVALMFVVALIFFDLNMRGSYLDLLFVVLLGTATLFGVGLAVGGWAKNENQAAPLANLVTFPMMFLSGSFFPRYIMPEWLQTASTFLPLTPVIDSARYIITEGKTVFDLAPQIGLMAVWCVVIYIIAFRVFRWD